MTMIYPDFQSAPTHARGSRNAGQKPGVYRNVFKRLLDISVILLAAPAVVPVVAGLVIAVACDGGNPFYSQMRVGRGGVAFRMWKLRSMVAGADALLEQHLASDPAARQEWDETQKLQADPRVTRFGRLLRRTSLDELPQLWNVLRGDMSLVGPRPMMVNQQEMYKGEAYYALRPGITGYWQTAGRNRTSFAARADIDTAYEAELTLATDLRLLVKTVSVVLRGTGC
jgi:exopolysaccharide production protein ExoY